MVCAPMPDFSSVNCSSFVTRENENGYGRSNGNDLDVRRAQLAQTSGRDFLVCYGSMDSRGGSNERKATAAKFTGIANDYGRLSIFHHDSICTRLQQIWSGEPVSNIETINREE